MLQLAIHGWYFFDFEFIGLDYSWKSSYKNNSLISRSCSGLGTMDFTTLINPSIFLWKYSRVESPQLFGMKFEIIWSDLTSSPNHTAQPCISVLEIIPLLYSYCQIAEIFDYLFNLVLRLTTFRCPACFSEHWKKWVTRALWHSLIKQ